MEWQPIETAPKDGTYVLVICRGETVPTVGFYSHRSGGWDDGDFNDYMTGFTHWMPLPPPPDVSPTR